MLSRVADSLYWMSRYLERAEHTARVIDVQLNLELEQPLREEGSRWPAVFQMLQLEVPPIAAREARDIVRQICFDPEDAASIVASVRAARDNARQVREQISSEMFEYLNRLYHDVSRDWEVGPELGELAEFLACVKEGSHLFQGITDSTMTHGEGWQFIQLGRFMERAINIATLVEVNCRDFDFTGFQEGGAPLNYMEWVGLLKCATAFEAYCKVHSASLEPERVVEFLLLSEQFPHSLRFSADMLHNALTAIGEMSPSRRGSRALRLAGRLKAGLSYSHIDEIIATGLRGTLDDLRRQCLEIHEGAYQAFITYPLEAALEN